MAMLPRLTKLAALLALGAGCTFLYDAGDFTSGGPSKPDATAPLDATSDALVGVKDPCDHARPPERPDAADPGAPTSLTFALSHFVLVAGNADEIGYDLDGVCTCDGRPGAALGGASSCSTPKPSDVCDNAGGRDNGASKLLARLIPTQADAGFEVGFDISASEGVGSILVGLGEYNGTPTDPSVFVALYDSPGLDPPRPCDAGTVGDGGVNGSGKPKPAWGGCDHWQLGQSSVLDGKPRWFTRDAWVTGGVLVANLPLLAIRIGRSDLLLSHASVTGTLVTTPGALPRLNRGIITGSATVPNLLKSFGEQEPIPGRPLCRDPLNMAVVRAAACASRDLGSTDDAAAPCDSISFTASFDAKLAQQGTVAESSDAGPVCGDLGELGRCP